MQTGVIEAASARVHAQLGPGHREAVYQRALVCELRQAGHWVQEEVPVAISYQLDSGQTVVLATERADVVVDGTLVVELKAGSGVSALLQAATRQARRYKAYLPGATDAVVVLFGTPSLEVRAV
jgi:GxxExxY protein